MAEQFAGATTVDRVASDTYRSRNVDRSVCQQDRLANGCQHTPGHIMDNIVNSRFVRPKQNGKLVVTQASQNIGLSQGAFDTQGYLDDNQIRFIGADGIIDNEKIIDIDVQNGHLALVQIGAVQCSDQKIHEGGAIGQAG